MSIVHEYSLPRDFEYRAWFADLVSSHHLTSHASYLHFKNVYSGNCRVNVAISQSLSIRCVDSTHISSSLCPLTTLVLNDILLVLCITRNPLSVSKFSCDNNNVVFEFLDDKCFIKSQVSKLTLLKGFHDLSRLYFFPRLDVEPSRMSSMCCSNYSSICTNAKFVSCFVRSSVNLVLAFFGPLG